MGEDPREIVVRRGDKVITLDDRLNDFEGSICALEKKVNWLGVALIALGALNVSEQYPVIASLIEKVIR